MAWRGRGAREDLTSLTATRAAVSDGHTPRRGAHETVHKLGRDAQTFQRVFHQLQEMLLKLQKMPRLDLLAQQEEDMLEAITKIRSAMESLARGISVWLRRKQAECPRLLWLTDEQLALSYHLWR